MTLKERTAVISLVASLSSPRRSWRSACSIGSLALITDALHSCVDFFATGVTWMAVRVADRPADASHPYGHGKFENIAALGGGDAAPASGRRRHWWRPSAASRPASRRRRSACWRSRSCSSRSASTPGARARCSRVGRETQSAALEADSLHFASDVFSSFAVLAGFGLIALGVGWGDVGGRHRPWPLSSRCWR